MKRLSLILFALMVVCVAQAQKKAVTDTGEEVVLYDDGTWKYVNADKIKETTIATNPKKFTKSSSSNFLVKSKIFNVGLWLNTQKWKFMKAENNDAAEYEFHSKRGDLYALMICEKFPLSLKALKMVALTNGRRAAPDLKLIKEEYRTVNGQKVLCLQMVGTLQGVTFMYYNYYYTNENGSMQLLVYTTKSLFANQEKTAEEL